MQNSPSCVCCEPAGECFHVTDQITPALFSLWTDEAGTWSNVDTGGIADRYETSDSFAQLIYRNSVPAFTDLWAILADNPAVDQKVRVLFSWEDVDNYWFVESDVALEAANTYRANIRLGQVAAGVETILDADTTLEFSVFGSIVQSVRVCYRDGEVRAYLVGPTESTAVAYTTALPAGDFGVGTGDQTGWDTPTTFEYFELWVNTTGTYDVDCGVCDDIEPTSSSEVAGTAGVTMSATAEVSPPVFSAAATGNAGAAMAASAEVLPPPPPTFDAAATGEAAAVMAATATFVDDCFSENCCDRPEPETGEANDLPATLNSEITDYTCDCLDNISFTHGVACLTGIDGKPFAWQGAGSNEWRMTGDIFCDIENPEDPGVSYESCEVSRETFILQCNTVGGCEDWFLYIDGAVGCTPTSIRPNPGYSCNPLDMTFVIPVQGCNCSPPGTPGDPMGGGVCDCSITIRIYETP